MTFGRACLACAWLLGAGLAVLGCGTDATQQDAVVDAATIESNDVLARLKDGHPRLFLTDTELTALKEQIRTDERLAGYWRVVQAKADALLSTPTVTYELDHRGNLLKVSKTCVKRVQTLALAYRITERRDYADRAIADLMAVCAHSSRWPDWNPSHFLDTAGMTTAVAIGYDWLYHAMTPKQRKQLRDYMIYRGLREGIDCYTAHPLGRTHGDAWWVRKDNNWNLVCNGGMIIGALAIAEKGDEELNKFARLIVPAAVKSMRRGIAAYEPDGAGPEGLMYWGYGTYYATMTFAAMESALGTDFGLGDTEAFKRTAWYPVALTGPTGYTVNFADDKPALKRSRFNVCLSYLADRYALPQVAAFNHHQLAQPWVRSNQEITALDVAWYTTLDREQEVGQEVGTLDMYFDGHMPVASMRSRADDPQALFVTVKAGKNPSTHGHLDLGTFEVQALGERWAVDLGGDDYGLPGIWEDGPQGKRWDYYRLGSRSHNVLLVDDSNQHVPARAEIARFEKHPSAPWAEVDLSAAYAPKARRVVRIVGLVDDRQAVKTTDTIELIEPADLAWGMTTPAAIDVGTSGTKAELKLNGKRMVAEILKPADASFSVESAEREPPEEPNTGMSRLMIRLADQPAGKHVIQVKLTPQKP